MRAILAVLTGLVIVGTAVINDRQTTTADEAVNVPVEGQVEDAGEAVATPPQVFIPLPSTEQAPSVYVDPELQRQIDELGSRVDTVEERLTAIELQQDLAALVPDISRIPIEENPLQEVPTEADAQPTPYEVIFKAIDLLDLKNTETLVDFGCGDARVLIHAFHDTGCRGIGIELDPDRAASARNSIRVAGLSPWIEIVEGDATTASVEGSVGFVYLWPETLEELRQKLLELDRFVSYAHAVPGLTMQRIDVPGHEPLWYWERAPEVSYSERPYAVYNGRRYYSDYNPGCNCSMCRTIRTQLASRENVEQIPIQTADIPTQSYSAPRTTVSTTTQRQTVQRSTSGCSNCSNGNCGRPRFRGRR